MARFGGINQRLLRDIDLLGKDNFEYGGPQTHKTGDEILAWLDIAMEELQASADRLPAGWEQAFDLETQTMKTHDDAGKSLQRLEGLWDLLMIGEESLEVKREHQRLTGGINIKQMCLGGPLVKKHNEPEVFEIYRWDSEGGYYCPASSLLDEGMLVVRNTALHEFEGRILSAVPATAEVKPSHLLTIAGLLELLLEDSRPRYTQGSAAEKIKELHPDWRGNSVSNLTKLFAEANAAAEDANKDAQAKADTRQAAADRLRKRKTAT